MFNSLRKIFSRSIHYIISGVPQYNVKAEITLSQPHNILSGKHILVTGGGRGLGCAMAKKFVAEGAKVLIAGRNVETLKKSSTEIGCEYLVLDINETSNFDVFIKEAEEKLGAIDTLVNNAGISLHEPTLFDVTEESFDKQISTNLKGPFFLSQTFIKHLSAKSAKGNILFVSSETGETKDFRPYGFSKAALNSMTQGFAYLLAEKGIRVNAIAPGVTASDMTGFDAKGNLYCSYNLTNRVYLPEEIAEVACFLLSDASGCMSGQILTCNNGNTINARWKQ